MTVDVPNLSALTPTQFFIALVIVAFLDFLSGVGSAIFVGTNTFDWNKVLQVLYTHGIQTDAPIGGLFAIGVVSGVPALCFAADGFLALYIVQTVKSMYGNLTPPPAPAAFTALPVEQPQSNYAPPPQPPTSLSHP